MVKYSVFNKKNTTEKLNNITSIFVFYEELYLSVVNVSV